MNMMVLRRRILQRLVKMLTIFLMFYETSMKEQPHDVRFALAILALFATGCSSEPERTAKPYFLPAEMTLEAHSIRGPEGELYITGTTNFPDGMKIWVHVGAPKPVASDDDVRINNSRFRTKALWREVPNPLFTSKVAKFPDAAKLKFRKTPIRAGSYKVQFEAYFNSGWQTPEVLTMLGGEGGKKLHGKLFKDLNPDVIDSSKALEYAIAVDLPVLTSEAKAISLVKAAVLTVPGEGRSATDIEANIDLTIADSAVLAKSFHGANAKGVLPAKGWIAKAKDKGTYEVIFDYTDGDAPAQAIWNVDLMTGVVRYINEHAKTLSWTPDY